MEGHQNLMTPTAQGLYPDHLESLTVWGLLKEAARVIQKHVRLLLPFVLIFTLPVSIFFAINLGSEFPYIPDGLLIHGRARSIMQSSFTTFTQQGIDPNFPTIAVIWVQVIILLIFAWLQMASVSYCVDFIYKGNDNLEAKHVQEIFKRLPRAVCRIFVTVLWFFCILIPIEAVHVLLVILLSSYPKYIMILISILYVGVILILSILFMFADILSTLELGCYGRPALKQSFILITKNKLRALGIFVVQVLITFIVLALGFVVSRLEPLHWTKPLGYICLFLLYLISVVYSLVLTNVFYFSCKLSTLNYMPLDVHAP